MLGDSVAEGFIALVLACRARGKEGGRHEAVLPCSISPAVGARVPDRDVAIGIALSSAAVSHMVHADGRFIQKFSSEIRVRRAFRSLYCL